MKDSRAMNVTLKEFCKENDVPNLGGNFRDGILGKLIYSDRYALSSWLRVHNKIQKEESISDSRKKDIRGSMISELFKGPDYFDIHKWKDHLNIISTIDPLIDFPEFPKFRSKTLEELSLHPNIQIEKQGKHTLAHLYLKDVPSWGITNILMLEDFPGYGNLLSKGISQLGYFHDHGDERVYIAPTFFPGGMQAQLNTEMSGIVPCFECGDAIIYDYEKYNL
jgi:hypothetical protein